jgi:chromosome segregation protein
MNERERDDYAAEQEQELRAHDARLAMTEARARENEAAEQLKELTGLKALQSKLKDHLKRFKEAGQADRDERKSDFESVRKEFTSTFDAIKAKLGQIDRVREEKLNAQLDQLDLEIIELEAKIQKKEIVLDEEDAKEMDHVHGQLEAAKDKRREVASAHEESEQEMKSGFGQAIDDLKRTWQHARGRVQAARHGAG